MATSAKKLNANTKKPPAVDTAGSKVVMASDAARKPANKRATTKATVVVAAPQQQQQQPAEVVAATPAAAGVVATAAQNEKKLTHSYRLFALLKKQKGIATTEELAAAAGLKPYYVSWYMAEMKRVYGIDYEHKRGEPTYRTPNLQGIEVPPHGVAGMRRGQQQAKRPDFNAEVAMADAIERAQKAIQQEFDRLRASLGKVKVAPSPEGEVRVASIPWDAWLQMKRELEQARGRVAETA